MSTAAERDHTLKKICDGFVQPSASNRAAYAAILECLWPKGTGLPGPVRTRAEIRAAVDAWRREIGKQPYADPFRRLREMQGEEGLHGIQKTGASYQMVSADVEEKRVPRRSFTEDEWAWLREKYGNRCAVCKAAGTVDFPLTPDHRKPRTRGGADGIQNLQLLCVKCNIHKSVACRGCQEDCLGCPWYDPQANPVVTLRGDLLRKLAATAADKGITTQRLAEQAVSDLLERSNGADDSAVG